MAKPNVCPVCRLVPGKRVSNGVLIWKWHNDRRGLECPKSGKPAPPN